MTPPVDDLPVALVTGAGAGIGAAVVRRLAENHRVWALDTSAEGLAQFEGNQRVTHVCIDASDERQLNEVVGRLAETHGRLEAVVANAGMCTTALVEDLKPDAWDRLMAVDLRGVYLAARATLDLLRASTAGAFVATSSELSLVGEPGLSAYAAAKAGVNSLIRVLALENATHGVRYNAVAPGPTRTRMMSQHQSSTVGETAVPATSIPMGRLAEPEEIAAVICFLLSPDSSFITGTVVVADGGCTAR